MVKGGVRSGAEVGDISVHLRSDAPRVLGAAIPLQVEGDLAVGEKITTPSVRCGAAVTLVCGATCCLTEPVIETLVGQVARPRRQPRKEPVGAWDPRFEPEIGQQSLSCAHPVANPVAKAAPGRSNLVAVSRF